ncbi:MAG: AAA family ATPase [Deltaproteobacteria bacterium]|nr:AAA family ATPase [Deltaproteobacteria bacterium]
MQCLQCQHENSAAAKFCEECGTRLVRTCPGCGHEMSPRAKFCPACGIPLTTHPQSSVSSSTFQVSSSQPLAPSTQPPDASPQTLDARFEGERRQLTVMFCDLVGSTALSARLDPEELREVVRTYQQISAAVTERFEGHIAQYLGDGLLVYFGYPVAHEDDAQRAVRAGLEIVETIRGQGSGVRGQEGWQNLPPRFSQPLQVRIGIHTGPVVVGEMGSGSRREQLALGETPNIAARVQGTAAPDTVVISAATYRLVEGLFECEEQGRPELKGVSAPLTLYRVVKAGDSQSRFEVVVRKGLTPLVGRDHEYGLLHERWDRVKDGEGQVVLLSGEPGIGKSRLVEALKETVEHEGAGCLELRCSPYAQNSALYPVIEHVQRVLEFRADDSPETKLEKLQRTLSCHPFPQVDTLPLLAALLSLPHPAGCPPLSLSPQKQKEKTQEALVAWLCAEAKQQAVTYAWEDLHWADPSTLELLTLFLNQVPTTRLLAVLTYRPEFTPPWGSHSYLSQLTLSRLGRTQVEVMVEKVTGGKALPVEVVRQIASKTDGVPLFVEELTKMVIESIESVGSIESVESIGSGAHGRATLPLGIPATLHDALMARLDRLGPAKEIAQVGATLGREFPYQLLQAVSPLNEETLQRGLKQVVEAELVYQSGLPPQARYLFKHALIQETAYQSLLKSRRQQLHRQVAQVLVEQFPETVETQPELVAHHYTEAGLIAQAIPYWQQAGQHAGQRGANAEAVSQVATGLELLKTLPDTPARTQQELSLQMSLGALRIATHGWASPEVENIYRRAQELCEQTGDTAQVFPVLCSMVAYHAMRAEHQKARALAEELFRVAQEAQDPDLLIQAHHIQGHTLEWIGKYPEARAHLEQGIALYAPQRHRAHTLRYGQDPGVACRVHATHVLWLLGYADQALTRAQEALALTQDLSHAVSVARGFSVMANVHLFRREWSAAQEQGEAGVAFAGEFGLPYAVAQISIMLGAALAGQGHYEEGISKMRQGLAAQRATGGQGLLQFWLAMQLEAYIAAGQFAEGWTVLEEALTIRPTYGDRYWEEEVYRLNGELLLKQSEVRGPESGVPNTQHPIPSPQAEAEAEACFQHAIGTAREQKTKSLELRATTSLARLWQHQGKRAEAHQLLLEIYHWFTEGFDTPDLQEAKELLQELAL